MVALIIGCNGRPDPFPDTGIEWLEVSTETWEATTCPEPGVREQTPFTAWELAEGWGKVPQDNTIYQYTGGGLVIAELNGDDQLDLYLPTAGDGRLLLSDGKGGWTDASEKSLPEEGGLGVGGCAADPDSDGDLDIYLVNLHEADQLLVNDGSGNFTDGTKAAGLGREALDATSCTWADVDSDGDLDLLVANHYEGTHLGEAILSGKFTAAHDNKLYTNDGAMVFTDQSAVLPAEFRDGYGFLIIAEDLDLDGNIELYSIHDFGPMWRGNQLLRGSGLDWEQDEELSGLAIAIFGMGAGITDLNGDGYPDLALTSWGEIVLVESDGAGSWVRSATARGITLEEDQESAWGAEFADLDNDQDDDLLVAFGPLIMPDYLSAQVEEAAGLRTISDQPDALFVQDDSGSFSSEAEAWGIADTGIGRGFVIADLDRDGWLDVVKRDLAGDSIAWRASCGSDSSLTVELYQPGSNLQAIGAELRATIGDRVISRRIRSGGTGHASSGPLEAHFGLGEATQLDQLTIVWPDGERSRLSDLAPGRIRITRSSD